MTVRSGQNNIFDSFLSRLDIIYWISEVCFNGLFIQKVWRYDQEVSGLMSMSGNFSN